MVAQGANKQTHAHNAERRANDQYYRARPSLLPAQFCGNDCPLSVIQRPLHAQRTHGPFPKNCAWVKRMGKWLERRVASKSPRSSPRGVERPPLAHGVVRCVRICIHAPPGASSGVRPKRERRMRGDHQWDADGCAPCGRCKKGDAVTCSVLGGLAGGPAVCSTT